MSPPSEWIAPEKFVWSAYKALGELMNQMAQKGFDPGADMTEPITATIYMAPDVRFKLSVAMEADGAMEKEFKPHV